MDVLKQLTAVPLFATAIWLAWVYGQLFGADGMNRMALIFKSFLILAIAGWALGRWPAHRVSTVAAVALIGLAMVFPFRKSHTQAEVWEPWSPESLAAARSSGNPVFVDFTAAWCLSCQVNEATVLRSQSSGRSLRSNTSSF
jgi:thiol:disulfide interchange protein